MKKLFILKMLLTLSILIGGCGGTTETAEDANANAIPAKPAKTLEATLNDLDKSATEAWMKNNGRFFETFLTNNFVEQTANGPVDKPMVVKFINEIDCDVASAPISEFKVTELGEGSALTTGKLSPEGTCEGKKIPDSYFASFYIKEGDSWKAAYHQSVYLPAKEEAKAGDAAKAGKPAAEGEARKEGARLMPNIRNDEELAKMFAGRESALWMAWADKDTKPFEEAFAADYSEIGATGLMDRAAAIRDIAENKCDITATSVTDIKATKINDSFVLVTYKGTAKGVCEGNAMPDAPLYTASIWMKDGDNWKSVFHMFTPGQKS